MSKRRTFTCGHCGSAFEGYGSRRFCSRTCADEAMRLPLHTCCWCGEEYRPKRGRYTSFCSRACAFSYQQWRAKRWAAIRKRNAHVRSYRLCAECGSTFYRRAHRLYCSADCRSAVEARRAREAAASRHEAEPRPCRECGRVFAPEYGSKRRVFCSAACSKRQAKRVDKSLRRARKRTNGYVPFDPLDVMRRDGWRCQLCGVKTPPHLRGTHDDRAPELDHIVPLALGGAHTPENTQCACRACNNRKGATAAGQLALPLLS